MMPLSPSVSNSTQRRIIDKNVWQGTDNAQIQQAMETSFRSSTFLATSQPFQFPVPSKLRHKIQQKRKILLSKCSINCSGIEENFYKTIQANAAALILLNSVNGQAGAVENSKMNSICQIAADVGTDEIVNSNKPLANDKEPLMMSGMTARNFDPIRYSGRWFEVASLKRGFAGQGQEDCHCTQGLYTFDAETRAVQVDTFCVHGGPDGYITGIQGKVQCLSETQFQKAETNVERQEMIEEKCYLRFPTLPFIPKEPYDVITTDYDNFALVSGAKDKSFVQIYSRTPNPGQEFIDNLKSYLQNVGFDANQIKETPQDCELMPTSQLALMMSKPGMREALKNQFPNLELQKPVQLNPFTSLLDTVKKLLALYFK